MDWKEVRGSYGVAIAFFRLEYLHFYVSHVAVFGDSIIASHVVARVWLSVCADLMKLHITVLFDESTVWCSSRHGAMVAGVHSSITRQSALAERNIDSLTVIQ